jgi:hypothetical protein
MRPNRSKRSRRVNGWPERTIIASSCTVSEAVHQTCQLDFEADRFMQGRFSGAGSGNCTGRGTRHLKPSPWPVGIFGGLTRGTSGSQETRRWREMDSNPRSPVMDGDLGRQVPALIAVFELARTAVALTRGTKVVGGTIIPNFRKR